MASTAGTRSMDAPDSTWIGHVVGGRFRLTEELGAGGIAVVFRAEDLELSRAVAVKILKDAGHQHSELRARFEREAQVLAALSHPHVVSLVDYGVEEGRAYLVMELLKGQTLGDLLEHEGTLPPERALHIVRQVLRALTYAHGEGLLHRDLKPDNVFLQALPDTPDHVRLLDFGFAKFVAGERADGPALTQAGAVFGTPRYMAPEQLSGGTVDARADLYAVAVILYQMFAGRRPFEGEIREVLKAKVTEDAPRLSEIVPELAVAPELDAFFARALAMRRDQRFSSAQAFLEALEVIPQPWLRPREAAPAQSATEPSALPLVALFAVPAVLVLAVLLVLVVWLARADDAPAETAAVLSAVDPVPDMPAVEAVRERAPAQAAPSSSQLAAPVRAVRDAIARGAEIDAEALRALREHARAEPDDAAAQLWLGHVFATRGMRAMALGAYQRASELDPSTCSEPRMIASLVELASEADGSPGAGRLLRQVDRAAALAAVDDAIRHAGSDRRKARRLETLRASLAEQ